jgi:cold shock CspA family protein
MITDLKGGQRVQVSYHTVDGKMHATQIRVM